jgi:NAD(P)H-dependent FMN reductase
MSVAQIGSSVLAVVGTLHAGSVTAVAIHHAAELLRSAGSTVDLVDLRSEQLPLFNPDSSRHTEIYRLLQSRVERADIFILGTPDYHGSISSVLKNFLDHFWHEFAGKLFVSIVASHEKGLTVADQMRTIARQCNAWTLPYCISLAEGVDVKDGRVTSESLLRRLEMMTRDARVYGKLLAAQRISDLDCKDNCFLARQRVSTASLKA